MVQDDETWLLRLDPGESELKLIRGVDQKEHHIYHPSLYEAIRPARPEPWAKAVDAESAEPAATGAKAKRPSTPPLSP